MLSDDRVEKAVEYLRDNADDYGTACGLVKFLDHKRKVVRGQQFIAAEGTVGLREAVAESSAEYLQVITDLQNAETDKHILATMFKAAELTVSVWQTQNANNRRGNVQ